MRDEPLDLFLSPREEKAPRVPATPVKPKHDLGMSVAGFRKQILQQIRVFGPITIEDLERLALFSDLSRGFVRLRVLELLEYGMIQESGSIPTRRGDRTELWAYVGGLPQ